jgi:hypothetical protein
MSGWNEALIALHLRFRPNARFAALQHGSIGRMMLVEPAPPIHLTDFGGAARGTALALPCL